MSSSSKGLLATGATAVFGGLWTLVSGLTDPSFLMQTELWYPVLSVVAHEIGPQALPQVPWRMVSLLVAFVFVVVSLIQTYRQTIKKHA